MYFLTFWKLLRINILNNFFIWKSMRLLRCFCFILSLTEFYKLINKLTFLHAAVVVTVVTCRVRNPACCYGYVKWLTGLTESFYDAMLMALWQMDHRFNVMFQFSRNSVKHWRCHAEVTFTSWGCDDEATFIDKKSISHYILSHKNSKKWRPSNRISILHDMTLWSNSILNLLSIWSNLIKTLLKWHF